MPRLMRYEDLRTDIPGEIFEVVSYNETIPCEETSEDETKKLKCSICSKKYGTSLGLTIHQKEHSDLSKIKCSVCPQTFNAYNLMTGHYLHVHSFESSIIGNDDDTEELDEELERHKQEFDFLLLGECFICFEILSRTSLLIFSHHLVDNHNENKDCLKYFTFTCSRCNRLHLRRSYLENHWNTHCLEKWKIEEQNDSQIVCEKCGLNFSSEKSLSSHVKMFHVERINVEEKQKVVCEHCGKEFASKNSLQDHIARVHSGRPKKFKCDQCEKTFNNKNSLKSHNSVIHLGEKLFECKFCSKRFTKAYALDTHLNTHTGDKPFKCKLCDKSFAARSALTAHAGVHTGFNCSTCGKSMGSYQELCLHKRAHKINADGEGCATTPENPICEICGKEFKSHLSLKLHTNNVHRGVKSVCDICGKEYKSPMGLYQHKLTHNDLIRFACSLCDRKFRFSTNFYKHRKVSHSNQNAQIVKLITDASTPSVVKVKKSTRVSSGPKSVNKLKENPEVPLSAVHVHNETSPINHSPPVSDAENSNDSNIFCEQHNSSRQDNNSNCAMLGISSLELLIENPPNHSVNNVSFSMPQEVDDVSSNKAVSEKIPEEDQCLPSSPSASADDPPGATISALEYQTVLKNPNEYLTKIPEIKAEDQCRQQNIDFDNGEYETYFSDESDDFSVDEVSKNEQKLSPQIVSFSSKITEQEDSCLSHDYLKVTKTNTMKSFPLDPYSSKLIVKLKRLLEHNCTFCDKTFFMQTEREIRQHSRTHRNVDVSVSPKLKSHKNESVTLPKDTEPKQKPQHCVHCDTKNLTIEELIAHTSLEHPGLKAFKCDTCSELFRTHHSLTYHERASHFGYRRRNPQKESKMDPNTEKEFLCEECGKSFHSKRSVQSHVLKVHKAQSRFTCEKCPLSFPTLWRLTRHTKRHTGEKSFLCEDCGKAFFEQRDLSDHINAVHLKAPRKRKPKPKKVYKKKELVFSFSCTICPERFLGEKALKVHMELHDPSRKFSCDVCGLRYKFSSNVITHKNLKHKNK